MKLRNLKVEHFAGLLTGSVAFGPGLNILYGPNDLGKSTLADAIRLVLLLPHTSSHGEPYAPWTGAYDPIVELHFEMGPADIYAVRKEFGKRGSSLLQWSKNGRDFEDKERGRAVDKKLRELLQWGIAEPGGAGAAKGLPSSFLATALLSTQAEVGAVLTKHLGSDSILNGRERIAAALQAIGQDPLFVALLKETQARRDEGWTPSGALKKGKDSVLRAAAQNVLDRTKERDEWQKLLGDSASVQTNVNDLISRRVGLIAQVQARKAALAAAKVAFEQTRKRAEAESMVLAALAEVTRIERLGETVRNFEAEVRVFGEKQAAAAQQLELAKAAYSEAELALRAAEEQTRATDPATESRVARQEAELSLLAAEQRVQAATTQLTAAEAAHVLVLAEQTAAIEAKAEQQNVDLATGAVAKAAIVVSKAEATIAHCDLLARGLVAQQATGARDRIDGVVAERAVFAAKAAAIQTDLVLLESERKALVVPLRTTLPAMRKLSNEIAGARGALQVGLVVTVTPDPQFVGEKLEFQASTDGVDTGLQPLVSPRILEARGEIEIALPRVATVRVVGGSRSAQEKLAQLESRWLVEVVPHLQAAAAKDLEGLEAQVHHAHELDRTIADKQRECKRLGDEVASREHADEERVLAMERLTDAVVALGVPLDTLLPEITTLGPDPSRIVTKRRAAAILERDAATKATQAANLATLVERAANKQSRWEQTRNTRDIAIGTFELGVEAAIQAAKTALSAATADRKRAKEQLEKLDHETSARAEAIATAAAGLTKRLKAAEQTRDLQQAALEHLNRDLAAAQGKLEHAKNTRDLEDLSHAQAQVATARATHAALAIPAQTVDAGSLQSLEKSLQDAELPLEELNSDIDRGRGALEQVGGNITEERLRDAVEALEIAKRHESDLEAEYEAWKLLLEQMKEADAAQSSNLGNALGPVIGSAFAELTARKYAGVTLDANLGTQGVSVGSANRDPDRLSVGTREQLSTLYRLSLAEYLKSTLVLDDQLVQSDSIRMDWFRALLAEKAKTMQIIVFTCRPNDYLDVLALPQGEEFRDTQDGRVRAVDLGRVLSSR